MRKIVTLTQSKKNFKHGDWLMFDVILKSGTEVNIVRPNEPGNKLRIFKVIKNRGFRHQLSAFEDQKEVIALEGGMQFFYMTK